MGKSFNDDVFNDLDVANINGLNISKEAIQENKKAKVDIKDLDLGDINEMKKDYQKKKQSKKVTPQTEYEEILKEKEQLEKELAKAKELQEIESKKTEEKKDKEEKVKRTMIFKKEHLDIIDGLAILYQDKGIDKKDILKQIIDKGLEQIKEKDPKIIDKALKTKKPKKTKEEINIF